MHTMHKMRTFLLPNISDIAPMTGFAMNCNIENKDPRIPEKIENPVFHFLFLVQITFARYTSCTIFKKPPVKILLESLNFTI